MMKTFDCIVFLNEAAEYTRQRLAGLPVQDQVVYWRMRNKEILAEQKQLMKGKTGAQEYVFVRRLQSLRRRRKPFDCVAIKNQAQEQIIKELEGKSPKEQAAYWRKNTQAALKRQSRSLGQNRRAR